MRRRRSNQREITSEDGRINGSEVQEGTPWQSSNWDPKTVIGERGGRCSYKNPNKYVRYSVTANIIIAPECITVVSRHAMFFHDVATKEESPVRTVESTKFQCIERNNRCTRWQSLAVVELDPKTDWRTWRAMLLQKCQQICPI